MSPTFRSLVAAGSVLALVSSVALARAQELTRVTRPLGSARGTSSMDAFLTVPLEKLAYDDGHAPDFTGSLWSAPRALAALAPYAVVEGARAVYLEFPTVNDWTIQRAELGRMHLAVEFGAQEERAAQVRGRVYLPDAEATRLVAHPFTLDTRGAPVVAQEDFLRARHRHYAWRFEQGLPGGAWWRNRAAADAPAAPGDGAAAEGAARATDQDEPWSTRVEHTAAQEEIGRSYALLNGGRAVSENLRLDDLVRAGGGEIASVPLAELVGITTPELDWSGYEQVGDEGVDPLARFVPADHHAVFLPSFDALVRVVDELRKNGTPVLDVLDSNVEDARVESRYEAQLALELDVAARILGPRVVRSIAVTGGDPYLRTGSDLALIFECADAGVFEAFVLARIAERAKNASVEPMERRLGELTMRGAADAARDLSSWCARTGDVVVVTNSAPLAERLMGVAHGDEPSLAKLAEYRHFRARYPRGAADEAAFIVLTDGAIRRWCGPEWRIGSARRVRAGALLAEAAAAHAAAQFGVAADFRPTLPTAVPDFGALVDDVAGPRSTRYGTARFATPIAELDFDYVTPAERDGYTQWRVGYDRQWSNVFDPIAAQVKITTDGLALDLSVLPIALRTDYRDLLDIAGAARLAPDAGDPHTDALAHVVLAIDRDAPAVRQLEGFMSMIAPSIERPLGWIGDHVAVWLDDDQELLAAARLAEDRDEFLAEHGFDLPIGVQIAVREPLRLAGFLSAVKALVESAAPGVLAWETREAKLASGAARSYVAIEPIEGSGWDDTPSLYYGITPGRLVASLREDVLLRALERTDAGAAAPAAVAQQRPSWLGESLGVRFAEGFKEVLAVGLVEDELRAVLRRRAFSALPILNELRRLAPGADPLVLQAQLFGATVRCPGGGRFVWNDDHATYESSVFGCPAAPREGEALPAALKLIRTLSLGLTFDRLDERSHALRARASVERR
jgi:hypothetical protein